MSDPANQDNQGFGGVRDVFKKLADGSVQHFRCYEAFFDEEGPVYRGRSQGKPPPRFPWGDEMPRYRQPPPTKEDIR